MIRSFGGVCTDVASTGMCSGCGVCSAVCPGGAIQMALNTAGEFRPEPRSGCVSGCGLCTRVCPSSTSSVDQDDLATRLFANVVGIRSTEAAGYVHQCFAGYSRQAADRDRGASGGMTTWILRELLVRRDVGRAIAARMYPSEVPLVRAVVLESVAELESCRGSFYYPVEYSRVIREVIDGPETTYAIVALPCTARAIRLAAEHHSVLKRRIRYILGLVCGQCPSVFYTEFQAAWSGLRVDQIGDVDYRARPQAAVTASEYGFVATSMDGRKKSRLLPYGGVPYHACANHMFIPEACAYCEDVFAEVADVALMDAWLPEYVGSPNGTSLMISRNPRISCMLSDGMASGGCSLKPVSVDAVVKSQDTNIQKKTRLLNARLAWDTENGTPVPHGKAKPDLTMLAAYRPVVTVQDRFRKVSRRLWPTYRSASYPWLSARLFALECFRHVGWPAVQLLDQTYALLPFGLGVLAKPIAYVCARIRIFRERRASAQ